MAPLKKKKKKKRLKGPSGITGDEVENLIFFFFFAFHFLKPLKYVLGLPKWKFYATEGPPPSAADRALFLKSASVLYIKNTGIQEHYMYWKALDRISIPGLANHIPVLPSIPSPKKYCLSTFNKSKFINYVINVICKEFAKTELQIANSTQVPLFSSGTSL